MKSVCIITARGGSKRIPRKNIRMFCGKPIIAYSIEAALGCGLFDEVMVSTDDDEIADIAIGYGATVPYVRSEETSNDFATTSDVIREVLASYGVDGRYFDFFFCVYPTAPFVTSERLKEAFGKLEEGADSVVSVVQFSFPPQRGLLVKDGSLVYEYPEYQFTRSQDLAPVFHDAGQFYGCRTEAFRSENTLFAGSCKPVVLPESEVQDIDTEEDWILAELKYKRMKNEQVKLLP